MGIALGRIAQYVLPHGPVLHAEIKEDILPAFSDPGDDVPVESYALRTEIAHLSVKPLHEFRCRDLCFWEAFFDDLFEG